MSLSKVQKSDVLKQKPYVLFYIRVENETSSSMQISPENFLINTLQIDLPSITDIKNAQLHDKKIFEIISKLKNDQNIPPQLKEYKIINDLLMHTTLLYTHGKQKKVDRIVIPDKFKPHILAANHLSHFGVKKTYDAIRQKYFWESLYTDTKNYVESCKYCISYKSPNKIPQIPIQRNYIPTKPMEYISCDFIGKLPVTAKGNCYILTFIDHFTKFVKLYPVSNQTAETTAEKLLDFICTFGTPDHILSDRGTNFMSAVFNDLCRKFGIIKLQTLALNPRCNGQSERINLNIKKSLSIFAMSTKQWDNYTNYYALLYNTTIHSATNETPAYLHMGYDFRLPVDILNSPRKITNPDYRDFVAKKTHQLQFTYDKVRSNLTKAAEVQEAYQHQFSKYRKFYLGQLVFLFSPESDRNSGLPKRRNYIGPFRIIKQHNNVNFTILDISNPKAQPMKVNSHRLIPYPSRREKLEILPQLIHDNTTQNYKEPVSLSSKPHAKFGTVTDTDWLYILQENENSPLSENNNAKHTAPISVTSSPESSQQTIIYDPHSPKAQKAAGKPDPSNRTHSYNLRSRVERNNDNFANRFLQ